MFGVIANLTLSRLIVSQMHSNVPMLEFPEKQIRSSFSLSQSQFKRLFSHVIAGRVNPAFYISQSTFTDFLAPPVHLSGTNMKNEIITEQLIPTGPLLSLSQCHFISCQNNNIRHKGGKGGAMCVKSVELEAIGCSFRDNFAINRGGAIHVCSAPAVRISESIFDNNTANSFSGALSEFNVHNTNLQNVNFTRNRCPKDVSGVSLTRCLHANLSHIIFYNNRAMACGCLYIMTSNLSLSMTSFHGNKGGSFAADGNSFATISYAEFADNSTHSITASSTDRLITKNCHFAQAKSREIIASSLTETANKYNERIDSLQIGHYTPIVAETPAQESESVSPKRRTKASILMIVVYVVVMALIGYSLGNSFKKPNPVVSDQERLVCEDKSTDLPESENSGAALDLGEYPGSDFEEINTSVI